VSLLRRQAANAELAEQVRFWFVSLLCVCLMFPTFPMLFFQAPFICRACAIVAASDIEQQKDELRDAARAWCEGHNQHAENLCVGMVFVFFF